MRYLKMFIAGLAFPSTLLPFLLLAAWNAGNTQMFTVPFLHFIPIAWGIWNVLYFVVFTKILPWNRTIKLLVTGAALGLLIALYGVFVADIPHLMGVVKPLAYLPLIVAPIIYALFWLFIVNPLNHLLGIDERSLFTAD